MLRDKDTLFQSTLPREERLCSQRMDKEVGISIHAPTRGATNITSAYVTTTKFQSTLPREERRPRPCSRERLGRFQSTLPREERPHTPAIAPWIEFISIHAPTRGATMSLKISLNQTLFQSTLPREERLYPIILYIDKISNFNPRSHERSDNIPFVVA